MRPVCRVVCRGETQNFIAKSTFLSSIVIYFSFFCFPALLTPFVPWLLLQQYSFLGRMWYMDIIKLSLPLSLFGPNIYSFYQCWHSPLSLLDLYMLHKQLRVRRKRMLNLNCSWQERNPLRILSNVLYIFRPYFSNDYNHNTPLNQRHHAEARRSGPLPWRQISNRQQAVEEF